MTVGKRVYIVITSSMTMLFTRRAEARAFATETDGILVESAQLGQVKRTQLETLINAFVEAE